MSVVQQAPRFYSSPPGGSSAPIYDSFLHSQTAGQATPGGAVLSFRSTGMAGPQTYPYPDLSHPNVVHSVVRESSYPAHSTVTSNLNQALNTSQYSAPGMVIPSNHPGGGAGLVIPSNHTGGGAGLVIPSNHPGGGAGLVIPSNHPGGGAGMVISSNHPGGGTGLVIPSNHPGGGAGMVMSSIRSGHGSSTTYQLAAPSVTASRGPTFEPAFHMRGVAVSPLYDPTDQRALSTSMTSVPALNSCPYCGRQEKKAGSDCHQHERSGSVPTCRRPSHFKRANRKRRQSGRSHSEHSTSKDYIPSSSTFQKRSTLSAPASDLSASKKYGQCSTSQTSTSHASTAKLTASQFSSPIYSSQPTNSQPTISQPTTSQPTISQPTTSTPSASSSSQLDPIQVVVMSQRSSSRRGASHHPQPRSNGSRGSFKSQRGVSRQPDARRGSAKRPVTSTQRKVSRRASKHRDDPELQEGHRLRETPSRRRARSSNGSESKLNTSSDPVVSSSATDQLVPDQSRMKTVQAKKRATSEAATKRNDNNQDSSRHLDSNSALFRSRSVSSLRNPATSAEVELRKLPLRGFSGASLHSTVEFDKATEGSSTAWEVDGRFLTAFRKGATLCPDYILAKHPEFKHGELPSPLQMYYFDETAPNDVLLANDVKTTSPIATARNQIQAFLNCTRPKLKVLQVDGYHYGASGTAMSSSDNRTMGSPTRDRDGYDSESELESEFYVQSYYTESAFTSVSAGAIQRCQEKELAKREAVRTRTEQKQPARGLCGQGQSPGHSEGMSQRSMSDRHPASVGTRCDVLVGLPQKSEVASHQPRLPAVVGPSMAINGVSQSGGLVPYLVPRQNFSKQAGPLESLTRPIPRSPKRRKPYQVPTRPMGQRCHHPAYRAAAAVEIERQKRHAGVPYVWPPPYDKDLMSSIDEATATHEDPLSLSSSSLVEEHQTPHAHQRTVRGSDRTVTPRSELSQQERRSRRRRRHSSSSFSRSPSEGYKQSGSRLSKSRRSESEVKRKHNKGSRRRRQSSNTLQSDDTRSLEPHHHRHRHHGTTTPRQPQSQSLRDRCCIGTTAHRDTGSKAFCSRGGRQDVISSSGSSYYRYESSRLSSRLLDTRGTEHGRKDRGADHYRKDRGAEHGHRDRCSEYGPKERGSEYGRKGHGSERKEDLPIASTLSAETTDGTQFTAPGNSTSSTAGATSMQDDGRDHLDDENGSVVQFVRGNKKEKKCDFGYHIRKNYFDVRDLVVPEKGTDCKMLPQYSVSYQNYPMICYDSVVPTSYQDFYRVRKAPGFAEP